MQIPDIPEPRHFLLEIVCEQCEKSHRLHELKDDFMGRLYCIHCNCRNFKIQKRLVTEAKYKGLSGKDRIVFKEITRVKWRGKKTLELD